MNRRLWLLAAGCMLATTEASAAGPPGGPLKKCPADAVVAGTTCMDKYEASVWRVPDATTTNKGLVAKIQNGKATLAHLVAAGATQLGIFGDDYAPCDDAGQTCDDVFAVSLPGVTPSNRITWFQAQAACRNARKRLPSNAEWQAAVIGTPDPGPDNGTTDCNSAGALTLTGSRSACKSARGAFDMVGNAVEWVADWAPRATHCGSWAASVSATADEVCFNGAATTGEPGALSRGSGAGVATATGPLTVYSQAPTEDFSGQGFRCAR